MNTQVMLTAQLNALRDRFTKRRVLADPGSVIAAYWGELAKKAEGLSQLIEAPRRPRAATLPRWVRAAKTLQTTCQSIAAANPRKAQFWEEKAKLLAAIHGGLETAAYGKRIPLTPKQTQQTK